MSKKVLREIARLPTAFNKPSLVCNHYFSLIKEGFVFKFFNHYIFQLLCFSSNYNIHMFVVY